MAEKMWNPSLDHELLISEFLDGYYGTASPFVRLYMDTMHAAVDETEHFLRACCVGPPLGVHKSYLTPMALLTSATAFRDGLHSLKPADTVYRERVERASMAVSYVFLWRWDELRTFAKNISLPSWPLAQTQQLAFTDFARIFNRTGTQMLTSSFKGANALSMLHACVFGDKTLCPSGGSRGGGALYSEVVLGECATASSTGDCRRASSWTAVPADLSGATIFKSGLSTTKACYAMNLCDVNGVCDPVVAYGDASGSCSKAALQNSFVVKNGLLAHPKGFTTEACMSKAGCCVQASPRHGFAGAVGGAPNATFSTLTVAPCDPSNVHQQFEVESKNGKPGQIRDKLTGRCLSAKKCKTPH